MTSGFQKLAELSIQNVKFARFARNVEWDWFPNTVVNMYKILINQNQFTIDFMMQVPCKKHNQFSICDLL